MEWQLKTMADIAEPVNGIVDGPFGSNLKKSDYIDDSENGIPVLTTKNLHGDYSKDSVRYISKEKYETLKRSTVYPGDILVAKIGSIGTCGIYPLSCKNALIPANLLKITVLPTVDRKYVYYYIQSRGFQEKIKAISTATAQPAFNVTKFRKLHIPIPPLQEQKRIVARIEELFSELDAGVETLQKIKQQLSVYRRSVLSDAFEGRISATWRKENNVKASCYVQKARDKRNAVLQEKGLKQLKYEWKDDIDLPVIPDEWEFAQIGDIAWEIKDGPHYSPDYVEEGVPFITGGNVRPNGVDFKNAKRISPELHKELSKRCHPQKGDMLYTKGGTTGIARINTYDQEFSVWVHVAVIKYVDLVLPEYFQHVLNSPFCYQQSQKYTHGVGNQDLGLTRMINIIFPICSREEQLQIVKELEARLSLCDDIEKTVDQALQQSAAMRQSILKQAFEGGLQK